MAKKKAAARESAAEKAKRESAVDLLKVAEEEIERREWLIEYVKAGGDDPNSDAMQGFIEGYVEDPEAFAWLMAHEAKVSAPGYVPRNLVTRTWSAEARPVVGPTGDPLGDRDLDQMYSSPSLAKQYGVDSERLRKRLDYWRGKNPGSADWTEVENRAANQPKYLYRLRAVVDLVKSES